MRAASRSSGAAGAAPQLGWFQVNCPACQRAMQAQLPAGVTNIECVRESCAKEFAVQLHASQLPPAVLQPSRRQPRAPRKVTQGLKIYNEYIKASLPLLRREQPGLMQQQLMKLLAQRWPTSEMNPKMRCDGGDAAGQQRNAAADGSAPDEDLGGDDGPAAAAAARGARGLDADPAELRGSGVAEPTGRGGDLGGTENQGAGGASAEPEAVRVGPPSPQREAESSDDELSLEPQGGGPRRLRFTAIHGARGAQGGRGGRGQGGGVAAARRDAEAVAAIMPTAGTAAGSSSRKRPATAPASAAARGKAPRRVPHCRTCGVPRKGHVCPGASAPAAASGVPVGTALDLEEMEAAGDTLAGMLLGARRQDVADDEMRGRVAGEVDEIMDNGVRINPLLRATCGGGNTSQAGE